MGDIETITKVLKSRHKQLRDFPGHRRFCYVMRDKCLAATFDDGTGCGRLYVYNLRPLLI